MTTQLNILFMAMPSRTNVNGETAVYCRLTYKQRQKRFMIGCTVPLVVWHQPKQQAKGKSAKAESVNQQIRHLEQKIYKAEADLLKAGEPFEVEDIINKVQGKEKGVCRTLMQVYQFRNRQMGKLVGVDFKASTLRKFNQLTNVVRYFIRYQYKAEDVLLTKVNAAFLQDLETYLKTEKAMRQVTVNKVIQKVKSIMTMALDRGWTNGNPFPGHRFKHDRPKVVYLTIDELEHLENYAFSQPRLERVRDIFLFSVYTGLQYDDAMSLDKGNIIKGVDGRQWISYTRQKTGKVIPIPLLDKARHLIDKFQKENEQSGHPSSIVPRISNQKINSYLKEVAGISGTEKLLTHKVARKTFGSLLLYYNVPMKVVSELMGHSSVLITERHYAQVELKRLGEAITGVDNLISLPISSTS